MRFLVDENLPVRLARWLRDQGHQADHVLEIGLGAKDDRIIMARARTLDVVIVTKDKDFTTAQSAPTNLRVVWLRLGNMESTAVVAACANAWPGVVQALNAGEKVVQVRQRRTAP